MHAIFSCTDKTSAKKEFAMAHINTGNKPDRDNSGINSENQKGMGREQEQRQAGHKDDAHSPSKSKPGNPSERTPSSGRDQ